LHILLCLWTPVHECLAAACRAQYAIERSRQDPLLLVITLKSVPRPSTNTAAAAPPAAHHHCTQGTHT
jgi:hypothetical protein